MFSSAMPVIEELISQLKQSVHCAICCESLRCPVITQCNHFFCRFCVMELLQLSSSTSCPLCKGSITKRNLRSSAKLTTMTDRISGVYRAYEEDSKQSFSTPLKPPMNIDLTDEFSQRPMQESIEQAKDSQLGQRYESPRKSKSRPIVMMGMSARKQRSQQRAVTATPTMQDSDSLDLFTITQPDDGLVKRRSKNSFLNKLRNGIESTPGDSVIRPKRFARRSAIKTVPLKPPLLDYEPGPCTQQQIDNLNDQLAEAANHNLVVEEEDKSESRFGRKRRLDKREHNEHATKMTAISNDLNDAACQMTKTHEVLYEVEMNSVARAKLKKTHSRSTSDSALSMACASKEGESHTHKVLSGRHVSSLNLISSPFRRKHSLSNEYSLLNSSLSASKRIKRKYKLGGLWHSCYLPVKKQTSGTSGWSHFTQMKHDMNKRRISKLRLRRDSEGKYSPVKLKKLSSSSNLMSRAFRALGKRSSKKHSTSTLTCASSQDYHIEKDTINATVILETEDFDDPVEQPQSKHPLKRIRDRISSTVSDLRDATKKSLAPQDSRSWFGLGKKKTDRGDTPSHNSCVDIQKKGGMEWSLSSGNIKKPPSCLFLRPKPLLGDEHSTTSTISLNGSNLSCLRTQDPGSFLEHLHCSSCGETILLGGPDVTFCATVDLSVLDTEPAVVSTSPSITDNGNKDSRVEINNADPKILCTCSDNEEDVVLENKSIITRRQTRIGTRRMTQIEASRKVMNMNTSDLEIEIVKECELTSKEKMATEAVENSEVGESSLHRSRLHSSTETMTSTDQDQLRQECEDLEAHVAALEQEIEDGALSPASLRRLLASAVDSVPFSSESEEQPIGDTEDIASSSTLQGLTMSEDKGNALTPTPLPSTPIAATVDTEPDVIPSSQEDEQQTPFLNSSTPPVLNAIKMQTSTPAAITVVPSNKKSVDTSQLAVTGSGLGPPQLVQLKKFCRQFQIKFHPKFLPGKTTHVVMKGEPENNLIVQRTLKYFLGILNKTWIVSFDWINRSLFASTLFEETNHEIRGDVACGDRVHGPSKARLSLASLFSSLSLCAVGNLGLLTIHDLELLVESGGGIFISSPDKFLPTTARRRLILANQQGDDFSMEACQELYRRYEIPIISVEWLLDSISHYQRLPLGNQFIICASKLPTVPSLSTLPSLK